MSSQDTIIAVSSPPGAGPRAVVRLSGPQAHAAVQQRFSTRLRPRQLVAGQLMLAIQPAASFPTVARVPATAILFLAPASYTGEDVVELHVVSSTPLLNVIIREFIELGCRSAEAGEFTRRAVLNGKLTLTAAEGVAQLISAENDLELRAGQVLLEGSLAARVRQRAERLSGLLALVEAGIDFADEGIRVLDAARLLLELNDCITTLADIAATPLVLERLPKSPAAALVGRPNVGKSTLFNALTQLDRAICSPVAGTTRDVLRAPLYTERPDAAAIDILDTAGLDNSETAAEAGSLDAAMKRQLARAITLADALVIVADFSAGVANFVADVQLLVARFGQEIGRRPVLVVANKVDLLGSSAAWLAPLIHAQTQLARTVLPVSARTAQGLSALTDALRGALAEQHTAGTAASDAISARHQEALTAAGDALRRARDLLPADSHAIDLPEVVALELREALDQLGRVTGRTDPDVVLGLIFSRFCIGK